MKAYNSIGTSSTSESVTFILQKPTDKEAPSVQQALRDITTTFSQTVTFSCVFGGIPTPKVEWFKDGKTVKENISYENRLATLIVKEARESSIGKYSCKATNELGSVETSCSLSIVEKPSIVIEEKLLNQKLKVGTQWTVVAQIKGYPTPNIKWFKNDVMIESNQEFNIVNKENRSTITIISTKRSSTGKYTIKIENSHGSDMVHLNLRIFGKLTIFLTLYILFLFKIVFTCKYVKIFFAHPLYIELYLSMII